jgi:hypothetical protein
MTLGEGSGLKKKAASRPPGTLKETHPQFFPPPRPIIRTLDTEHLDAIDATRNTAKEAAKRRRPTMEEIKRLEKELAEPNERTMRCTLKMHNEVQAEKAKVLALERQMAMIAKKVRDSGTMEKETAPDEQYVSGGEEEIVFTRPTPSTHIRILMEIENKEKAKRDLAAREGRDAANRGRIAKKTSPHWDSDTGLSRDMNPIWENTEYSANCGRQVTGVRQSEPTKAQHTPTQRQVYTIDGDNVPATTTKLRGTTVERSETPPQ